MAVIDVGSIFKSIEDQAKALAEKMFKRYTHQAVSDVNDFIQRSRDDLKRWIEELARGEVDEEEFESLVKGQADLAEMHALKQAGLAVVQIDSFVNGVLDIVISAAFSAIP
jgi:predicted transcriptional regulator